MAHLHEATSDIPSIVTWQQRAYCRLTEAMARAGILSVPPNGYGELRGNFTDVLAAMAPDRSFFAEVTAQHLCP